MLVSRTVAARVVLRVDATQDVVGGGAALSGERGDAEVPLEAADVDGVAARLADVRHDVGLGERDVGEGAGEPPRLPERRPVAGVEEHDLAVAQVRRDGVHERVVVHRRHRDHDHVGAGDRLRRVVGDAGKRGEAGLAGRRLRVGRDLDPAARPRRLELVRELRQFEQRDVDALEGAVGGDRQAGSTGTAHRQTKWSPHAVTPVTVVRTGSAARSPRQALSVGPRAAGKTASPQSRIPERFVNLSPPRPERHTGPPAPEPAQL